MQKRVSLLLITQMCVCVCARAFVCQEEVARLLTVVAGISGSIHVMTITMYALQVWQKRPMVIEKKPAIEAIEHIEDNVNEKDTYEATCKDTCKDICEDISSDIDVGNGTKETCVDSKTDLFEWQKSLGDANASANATDVTRELRVKRDLSVWQKSLGKANASANLADVSWNRTTARVKRDLHVWQKSGAEEGAWVGLEEEEAAAEEQEEEEKDAGEVHESLGVDARGSESGGAKGDGREYVGVEGEERESMRVNQNEDGRICSGEEGSESGNVTPEGSEYGVDEEGESESVKEEEEGASVGMEEGGASVVVEEEGGGSVVVEEEGSAVARRTGLHKRPACPPPRTHAHTHTRIQTYTPTLLLLMVCYCLPPRFLLSLDLTRTRSRRIFHALSHTLIPLTRPPAP